MKYLGLLASALTLLLLGAAPGPDNKPTPQPLPGFPNISYTASLLEPRGADGKPLLKIVRTEYLQDRKAIVWLLELQTDIGFDEKRRIDSEWYPIGASKGPWALFFDKDGVAIYFREAKLLGKLYEGKKGDRVRLVIEPGQGLPDATTMEIRKP